MSPSYLRLNPLRPLIHPLPEIAAQAPRPAPEACTNLHHFAPICTPDPTALDWRMLPLWPPSPDCSFLALMVFEGLHSGRDSLDAVTADLYHSMLHNYLVLSLLVAPAFPRPAPPRPLAGSPSYTATPTPAPAP